MIRMNTSALIPILQQIFDQLAPSMIVTLTGGRKTEQTLILARLRRHGIDAWIEAYGDVRQLVAGHSGDAIEIDIFSSVDRLRPCRAIVEWGNKRFSCNRHRLL